MRRLVGLLFLLGLMLVGCAPTVVIPSATPVPSVTASPRPSATLPPPTATRETAPTPPLTTPIAFHLGPVLGRVGADTITIKAETVLTTAVVLTYGLVGQPLQSKKFPPRQRHEIILTDLQPGAIYTYQLGAQTADGILWSMPGRWVTDGGISQTIRLAVWADSRPRDEVSALPPVFHDLVKQLAKRGPFNLGVALGDNIQLVIGPDDQATIDDRYEQYLKTVQPLVGQMPFFPLLGNHDDPFCPRCVRAFKRYFAVPEQHAGLYYSLDYGPTHLTFVNSQQKGGTHVERLEDEQWEWLQADLAAADRPIKLVFIHDAIFRSSTDHETAYTAEERTRLHQLFHEMGVIAVFQGSAHYYDYFDQDGVAYVITGGAGSPLHEQPYRPEWMAHEALVLDVSATQVVMDVIQPDGQTLDQRVWTIK